MHEASLADGIVRSVLAAAEREKARRVKSVTVSLGEWSAFNAEQVGFWVGVGFEKTLAEGAAVDFETVEGRIRCRACGTEGPCPRAADKTDHFIGPRLECPACESPEVDIVSGREAVLKHIRIERDEPEPSPRH
jgi:hydrogenase nickel incorporation protein HypA/HybF